jgi:CheY-like chemotaxis protein
VFDSVAVARLNYVRTQQSRTSQTILVIEDYPDSREMLRLLLDSLDYQVITAKNGQEALAIAADQHIDLILTDLGLPDMTGVTVVRRLRQQNDHLRHVPIIMLTALDSNEHYHSAIQAGCTAFFNKPLDFDRFISYG